MHVLSFQCLSPSTFFLWTVRRDVVWPLLTPFSSFSSIRSDLVRSVRRTHNTTQHTHTHTYTQGSFALGVEEYVKQTEKKARRHVESRLRSQQAAGSRLTTGAGATDATTPSMSTKSGTGRHPAMTPAARATRRPPQVMPSPGPTPHALRRRVEPPAAASSASSSSSSNHPHAPVGARSGHNGAATAATPSVATAASPPGGRQPRQPSGSGRGGSGRKADAAPARPRNPQADAHHARGFALRKKGECCCIERWLLRGCDGCCGLLGCF